MFYSYFKFQPNQIAFFLYIYNYLELARENGKYTNFFRQLIVFWLSQLNLKLFLRFYCSKQLFIFFSITSNIIKFGSINFIL